MLSIRLNYISVIIHISFYQVKIGNAFKRGVARRYQTDFQIATIAFALGNVQWQCSVAAAMLSYFSRQKQSSGCVLYKRYKCSLKNLRKFKRKHLCKSLFFTKVAVLNIRWLLLSRVAVLTICKLFVWKPVLKKFQADNFLLLFLAV